MPAGGDEPTTEPAHPAYIRKVNKMPDENTFVLPDVLPEGVEELQVLEAEATAAFVARHERGATTPEDAQELRAISESIRTLRDAVAAAQASDVEPEADPEPEGDPEPEPEADPAPEPEAEPVPEPEATPEPSAQTALEALLEAPAPAGFSDASVQSLAAAIQALVASANAPEKPGKSPVVVHEAPPDTDLPVAATAGRITIVASADIPGIPASKELDGLDGLVAALGAKARSVPVQRLGTSNKGFPVATIEKPLDPRRALDELSQKDQLAMMEDLASVDFLVASGGWCAPSEQLYDLACEVEAPPDMVVLPTYSTVRGGVKFPISPTFADFMSLENNGLFTWTEANDIAAAEPDGPTKPCFKIPCVTFDEARLELEGLCVTAGNLMDKAYPELIRRYSSLVLNGHLHRMNTQKILKMLAFIDDTVGMPTTFAAASAVLDALTLQVADLRDAYSMSEGATIEGMAPRWLRGPLRVDVARREQTGLDTVSNADIDRYLESAGIRLQFVSNWQVLGDPDNPATQWPTDVSILLWLPGALRELTGPSLDINVARDSVLNETNDFSVMFTEESYQIYKPGCGVRLVEVPICPNGTVGERVEMICEDVSA